MSSIFNNYIMPAAPKMYRYAFSILKSEEHAHDVVQECLTKIWEGRKKLEEIRNHEAWVMRITRNQCYDWVKTNSHNYLMENENNRVETVEADHEMLAQDYQKWLDIVLSGIPDKHREVFHLREIEGMSYVEIAESLDMEISDVKVCLHRARLKVRSQIQKIEAYGIAN